MRDDGPPVAAPTSLPREVEELRAINREFEQDVLDALTVEPRLADPTGAEDLILDALQDTLLELREWMRECVPLRNRIVSAEDAAALAARSRPGSALGWVPRRPTTTPATSPTRSSASWRTQRGYLPTSETTPACSGSESGTTSSGSSSRRSGTRSTAGTGHRSPGSSSMLPKIWPQTRSPP